MFLDISLISVAVVIYLSFSYSDKEIKCIPSFPAQYSLEKFLSYSTFIAAVTKFRMLMLPTTI